MNAVSIPPIVMATLMFYVGFYHFLIYRQQRDNRENITFAFSCFSVGLYAICCAGLYSASSPEVGVEWQRLQLTTLALLAVALLWFIADYTKHANRKILLGFTVYYIFAALAELLIRSDLTWTNVVSIKEIRLPFGYDIIYNEMTPGVLTDLHSIVGLFYFFYLLSVSLKFYRNGNKEKGIPLLIAMAILCAGLINDTLMSSGFYDFIYILEYSYIGIILVFTFFLTNNVIKAGEIKIALLKEKDFSEHIINSMPGIFLLYQYENDKFNLKKWNKNHENILGFTKDELKNNKMESFFSEDHIPSLDEAVSQVINQGSVKTELELRTKDGSFIPFYINARLFKNADDTFIVGTGIDITEQKQFEKENQKLQSQLAQAQKMEAIGTLAGGIAHDFNNILSGILGYSQLAKKNINNPDKANNNIDQVIKGTKRAAELVQQILTFSRKTEYQKKPFQIYLEINEALKLLRPVIPSTIEIVKNLNSRSSVSADPGKIHQLIMNLCTNAYHAMQETGGCLTIELTETQIFEVKQLKHKKIIPGKYIKLEVSDTGHGMDEKDLEKAFDPYYTTKEIGEGTGFGLAIVQAVVDEHDGYLEVKSSPGKGTNFYIYFPIVAKGVEQNDKKSVSSASLKGNEKIMFVDDEEAIRKIAKENLEENGYEVILQKNGIEALKEFKKDINQFDLIITDMNMPGMAGDIFSTELKKINSDIPIVLCTGFSDIMTEEKAVAIGINAFLMKPIEMNDLCQKIRQLLDKKE